MYRDYNQPAQVDAKYRLGEKLNVLWYLLGASFMVLH